MTSSVSTEILSVDSEIEQPKQTFEMEKTVRNVILFDWDNTLFCTDYLNTHKVDFKALFKESVSLESFGGFLSQEIRSLEQTLITTFEELYAAKYDIYVITNADLSWLKNCLKHLLPDFKELLDELDIGLYSARKMFSKCTPMDKWKVKCFKSVLNENYKDQITELRVTAVGDSMDEKYAALTLKSLTYYQDLKVKFVEMTKSPIIPVINTQLDYLRQSLDKIWETNEFLHKVKLHKK